MLIWSFVVFFCIFFSVSSISVLVLWSLDAVILLVFVQFAAWWKHETSVESCAKFVVIQFVSSMAVCVGYLCYASFEVEWLLVLGFVMKLGIFPWHGWVPQVYAGVSWFALFLLSSVLKFSSFMVISVFDWSVYSYYCFMVLAVMTSAIGAFGGINQSDLKAMMGYSSLVWNGWMSLASLVDCLAFLEIFFFYCVGFGSFVFLMESSMSFSLSNVVFLPKNYSFAGFVGLLSLAGFPPFLFFFMKFEIVCVSLKLFAGALMLMSSFSIFFYLSAAMSIWFSMSFDNFKTIGQSSAFFLILTLVVSFFGILFFGLF